MQKQSSIFLIAAAGLTLLFGCSETVHKREYSGSSSCMECHEKFYKLWAPSHHAKALQPWSADLAAALPPQPEPIEAEGLFYMTHITPERGWMSDDQGKEYNIKYAMGGKNYYNFLTLMDDGRLQVLPVIYDVQHDEWKNTTLSMLRHFEDGQQDTPVSWRDSMLTFNAECFRCHVSQSESNYDPETDTYATTWEEPGISCESCHGPASEHVRVCKEAPTNNPPKNLEIIKWNEMSVEQQNASCAGCHTKGGAITDGFETQDNYWDHYDLTTFEHADYYPNGRDLGENYTMGSWWLSPCATKGNLSCTYCHTSSGRYKFKDNPNEACLPCHEKRRLDAAEHMHHPNGGATKCTDCHMAMHSFGGMNQSDHSMRPPMPNLSIAVGSRNACTLCHTDKSNEWALEHVREWHPTFDKDTEFEMKRALLVQALRDGDWDQLPAVLDYIKDPESDPLFTTSMIRLLPPTNDPQQHSILRDLATEAKHPLVRSAAAAALDGDNNPGDRPTLLAALSDPIRLVRVRAAERLAAVPEKEIPEPDRDSFKAAMEEMWTANNLRLDHWGSHYNAANILMRQQRYRKAAEKYDRAHELRDDIAPPLINGAMAFANLNELEAAETRLIQATRLPEPSPEAHFNLGLLYAEQGKTDQAETHLRKAFELQPQNAQAAYNLAILVSNKNMPETFRLLRAAIEADPYNPRHVETLAYYYMQTRQPDLAKKIIEQAFERGVTSPGLQSMYGQIGQ
ncbi:tetratricopeptide repeat protein [Tichowtungia aerotolerans]|uniref:Ammonia-forming cytochrome c nitrite reductase subunit c552 n=1 Tax=Tichowtungia aerotolerans TaxID=2697043 RepID=A0A6P1M7B8_9BACT|nr:tetratricopeptide repeat protein [Tichowtungia aerotolerans]QHI70649.1 ammonia-forming cytochrome c nitrite reductase subunit c552 [Tichowtungia aerotolerans]